MTSSLGRSFLLRARLSLCFAATFSLLIGLAPARAGADMCDCAQPLSSGPKPAASDCLLLLNLAVGIGDGSCGSCDDVVCRPNGGVTTTAVDALRCLNEAVGLDGELACPIVGSEGKLTGIQWSLRDGAKVVFGPA